MAARSGTGRLLQALGGLGEPMRGIASFGAYLAGREEVSGALATDAIVSKSRIGTEVAVLLDRHDLVGSDASPLVRARSRASLGDLDGAVELLESAGKGESVQVERLRSERRLMTPGVRLCAPRMESRRPRNQGERLRVLHLITNSLPHTQSGYSLRTHRILTSMRAAGIDSVALTRTGYPVMVGKPWAEEEDTVDGVRYAHSLPVRLGRTPEDRLTQEVAKALELVEEFAPHILHATTDYRNAVVAQAVSTATGIPWVFEVRGLMEQTWIASHRTQLSREIAARSQKATLIAAREGELASHADEVVTLSKTMADELDRRGVDPSRVTVVPNGVEKSLLEESTSASDARALVGLELPSDAFVVGAVSALVPYEGHDVLIRALAHIMRSHQVSQSVKNRLHLLLVGDGTAAPSLSALATELGVQERVLLPGRVPRGEAKYWIRAMDLVSVPRLDLEVSRSVTPQKPVEAMALGRPVVVSDLPALRETVSNDAGDTCAELVVAGDPRHLASAILRLVEQDQRRLELSSAGRALARERTWSSLMRRYVAAYDRALRDTRKGAMSDE